MKFKRRPEAMVIEAEQLLHAKVIETLEGPIQGYPGDWVAKDIEGNQYPIADRIFQKTWEPVEEDEE